MTTFVKEEHTMKKTEITAEPGVPQIVMTREFSAPRDLVFRAYTDPALLPQWLGPRNHHDLRYSRLCSNFGLFHRMLLLDECGHAINRLGRVADAGRRLGGPLYVFALKWTVHPPPDHRAPST